MFRLSRQYFAIESLALIVVETLLVLGSVIFAIVLRLHTDLQSLSRLDGFPVSALIFTGVLITCFYYNELYNGRWNVGLNFFIKLCISITIASLALMVIYYVLPQYQLGRGIFLIANGFILLTVSLWRYFYQTYLVREQFKQNVLIIGTGDRALELARIIEEKRNCGYCLVGFVDGMTNQRVERLPAERANQAKSAPALETRKPLLHIQGS